jgi:predicted choloylglycine hydrolase
VIATTEGIAGVADGINEDGLAVSLAFGGRAVTGPGFGIPLILRYLLEVCDRVPVAVRVLLRVPSHMSYNVTIVDRKGEHATVHVAPDRPAIATRKRVATNHQRRIEWPEQARFSRTLERQRHLESLLADPGPAGRGADPELSRAAPLQHRIPASVRDGLYGGLSSHRG